jgi:hypothetical protein
VGLWYVHQWPMAEELMAGLYTHGHRGYSCWLNDNDGNVSFKIPCFGHIIIHWALLTMAHAPLPSSPPIHYAEFQMCLCVMCTFPILF